MSIMLLLCDYCMRIVLLLGDYCVIIMWLVLLLYE